MKNSYCNLTPYEILSDRCRPVVEIGTFIFENLKRKGNYAQVVIVSSHIDMAETFVDETRLKKLSFNVYVMSNSVTDIKYF